MMSESWQSSVMGGRTLGMIKFLKKHIHEHSSYKEAAIAYMMEYSGCPREVYTENKINSIIFEAFCDFMDAVDRPSYQFRQLAGAIDIAKFLNKEYDIYNCMAEVMYEVQVCEHTKSGDLEYVNGFTEKDFENW